MTSIEKSRIKNAPLAWTDDRAAFVSWATSVPDGCAAAGWQPVLPRPSDITPDQLLRASGAKLVSLARKELNQTPDQIAATAGVRVCDVLAMEQGDDVPSETVVRVAGVLRINAEILAELFP